MPRFTPASSAFAPHDKWREAVRDTWRQTLLYIWEKPDALCDGHTVVKAQPAHAPSASQLVSQQA
ncbi:MAG: hypothetical protein ABF839_02595 [Acetobacter orientalis]|uniref:hypothetical protein n=1 Tax=Acetobacter orientalis TaxID=146474 RepID=UPI0039E7DDDC